MDNIKKIADSLPDSPDTVYVRIRGDEGCIVYYEGGVYFGRTGESEWITSSGQVSAFPEFDTIIRSGNYATREAYKAEEEAWDQAWDLY